MDAQVVVDEEIRRRTFWSCFIMDRYLSSGKFRPQIIALDDIKLQLPCGEKAWAFGQNVITADLSHDYTGAEIINQRKMVKRQGESRAGARDGGGQRSDHMDIESDDDELACELGPDEWLLARYVRITEIWGRVVKWSCAGGKK